MDNTMQEHFKVDVKGDALNIRHGELPDIFQYDGFSYKTTSAQGFIDLVRARANKERCVIFWDDDGSMYAIMDDSITDRPQDNVNFTPAKTLQYKEWEEVLHKGVTMDQKGFIDFLRTRLCFELPERDSLLEKVRKFSFVMRTAGNAVIDDNNNYSFAFKMNNVEGTVQIPASLNLQIMLFEDMEGLLTFDVDLEVNIPHEKGERLTFTLKCPMFERYKQMAIKEIVDFIREELDGYLMVRA